MPCAGYTIRIRNQAPHRHNFFFSPYFIALILDYTHIICVDLPKLQGAFIFYPDTGRVPGETFFLYQVQDNAAE